MTKDEALDYLNKLFVYQNDREQFRYRDVYKLITPESFRGDCEDYAVTLLWLLAGHSWPRFWWWTMGRKAKFVLYYHTERGTQHMALEFEGQEVCNITREWHDGTRLQKRGYKRVIGLPATMIFLKLALSQFLR